ASHLPAHRQAQKRAPGPQGPRISCSEGIAVERPPDRPLSRGGRRPPALASRPSPPGGKSRRAGIAPRPPRVLPSSCGLVLQHRQLLLADEGRRAQLIEVHTARHQLALVVAAIPEEVV